MKAAEEKEQKEKDPAVRVVDRRWWARGDVTEADQSGVRKPTCIEELEQRLADTTAQLQRVMTEHRHSLEEFEQVKSRLRRELAKDVERAKRTLLAELLDVLDNLDRAIAATDEDRPIAEITQGDERDTAAQEAASFLRGVKLVRDQFLSKLEHLGVARVSALGQPFDAQKHEAISTASVEDPTKDGTVVAVVKEGYAIGEDVLRPASVIVGRHDT